MNIKNFDFHLNHKIAQTLSYVSLQKWSERARAMPNLTSGQSESLSTRCCSGSRLSTLSLRKSQSGTSRTGTLFGPSPFLTKPKILFPGCWQKIRRLGSHSMRFCNIRCCQSHQKHVLSKSLLEFNLKYDFLLSEFSLHWACIFTMFLIYKFPTRFLYRWADLPKGLNPNLHVNKLPTG